MIEKSIAIYVFIDDLLIKLNHNEPKNRYMSDAELITTVLVSAIYFSGHHEKAMSFMESTGMIPHMLSKSRFNRRLVLPAVRLDQRTEHQIRICNRQFSNTHL
jgi:hypothetical protein